MTLLLAHTGAKFVPMTRWYVAPRADDLGNSMAVPVMRWIGQQIDYAMIWGTP